MKLRLTSSLLLGLALFVAAPLSPSRAQTPGGFSAVAKTDANTVAAAKAAVASREGKVQLTSVESAERQVVAGMNYRLTLKVTENGKARRAESVVWHKLDGKFETTSWTWLDAAPAQPGVLKSEFIYDTGPYPRIHAMTIVETPSRRARQSIRTPPTARS